MTHLTDGFYWAEDIATCERAIVRVKDGFYTVTRCPPHVQGGKKVKHVRDQYAILTEIKEPA
jgi:hypothetical protein